MTDQLKSAPVAYQNAPFLDSPDGRILRILAEYQEPLARFRREQIQDTVVFFGSARFQGLKDAANTLTTIEQNHTTAPAANIEKDLKRAEAGLGALQIFFNIRGGRGGVVLLDCRERVRGVLEPLKAGGAEEDNRVLNLLAAEARQGFLIFGQDAEDAAVRAVEERCVLVGYRRGFELVSHKIEVSRSEFRVRIRRLSGYQQCPAGAEAR